MQLLKIATLSIILFGWFISSSQAATDYNSSRSNKSLGAFVPDTTDELLKKVQLDASIVSKSMIEADLSDGYSGEYDITVDVHVRIERRPAPSDGRVIIRDVRKR